MSGPSSGDRTRHGLRNQLLVRFVGEPSAVGDLLVDHVDLGEAELICTVDRVSAVSIAWN